METTTDNSKTVAIIAYITIIGLVVAYIMNNNNKSTLGSFHIRQSLGIMCVGLVLSIVVSFIDISILGWVVQAGIFVLWILGLISAVQAEMKPVPVLGAQFQEWFKGI